MSVFHIEIPGPCIPKGAPRASVFIKNGKPQARIHKDVKTKKWMEKVATIARINWRPRAPLEGPVELRIQIRRRMASAIKNSHKKRSEALQGKILPTTKPDLDNYCKGIADALSGIVYRDDAQIVNLTMSKRFSDEEKTTILVQEIICE